MYDCRGIHPRENKLVSCLAVGEGKICVQTKYEPYLKCVVIIFDYFSHNYPLQFSWEQRVSHLKINLNLSNDKTYRECFVFLDGTIIIILFLMITKQLKLEFTGKFFRNSLLG